MSLDPALRLRKVVEYDESGQSITEFSEVLLSQIDYCVQRNDRAWTTVHHRRNIRMHVKESPDEIRDKIHRSARRLVGPDPGKLPEIGIYQDTRKCVLIHLNKVVSVTAISAHRTKFSFPKGAITIELPIELLFVPEKLKEVNDGHHN